MEPIASKPPRGIRQRPKGSGVWWICYHDAAGRQHREKIGSLSEAIEALRHRRSDIRSGRYVPPARSRLKVRGVFQRERGSGVWWIRYHDAAGQPHREKIGSYSDAVKAVKERHKAIRSGRFVPAGRVGRTRRAPARRDPAAPRQPKKRIEEPRIFELVETALAGKIRTRSAVVAARQAVSEETNLEYDTVAKYHQRETGRRKAPQTGTD